MRGNIDRLVEMGYDGVILTGGRPSTSSCSAGVGFRACALFSRMIAMGKSWRTRRLQALREAG
jgi:hypothetical protein